MEAAQARLQLAGLPVKLAAGPDGPPPNSWAAQERAVNAAVVEALEQERARVARQAARRKAERAAHAAAGATPTPPVSTRPRPA